MSGDSGTRCAALVGPYLSGKTTLMEAMLFASETINRKGSVKEGNSVGDAAPEARNRQMSTELSLATGKYLGDTWSFLDCPGSIELWQDALNAMPQADIVVVVFEPSSDKAVSLAPIFRYLSDNNIPHMLFINKIDTITEPVLTVHEALKAVSPKPLVLRQIPIREGEEITGYVDLISGRAYRYKANEASDLIDIPDDMSDEYLLARQEMLESLSDFDDTLLERLLEDETPPVDEIYGYLTSGVQDCNVVPVMIGSAELDYGVRRLLKALRHETPGAAVAADRLGYDTAGEPTAQVFKTVHAQHSGKLSYARVWSGELTEGMTLNDERIGGLSSMLGNQPNKIAKAGVGDVVALGRMDAVKTGDVLTASGDRPELAPDPVPALTPVYAVTIHPENRADEVKLASALQRIAEEDTSLAYGQNSETNELLIRGQGEIHLRLALEKLEGRYGIKTAHEKPSVAYKETIRRSTEQHGRFKRQTGGHGMFGDVHVEIKPLPRGTGFAFEDNIVGGSVPKQYIPAVENGIKEYADRGPLGFPVVDFAVRLYDGQFHSVDSNEMSFKLAGRVAMSEGMPKCDPVLLEPISKVEIDVPADQTNKVHGLISGRRGQILGFGPKESWDGWDTVTANMPSSEIHDLIIELRSLTQGVGTYRAEFDHLQELQGRIAEDVVAQRAAAIEAERAN